MSAVQSAPHEAVWRSGETVDPAHLDDAQLTRYRHPGEWRTLMGIVASLAVIAIILALLGPDLRATLRDNLDWVPRGLLGTLLSVVHPEGFVGAVAILLLATAGLELYEQWLRRTDVLSSTAEITPTTYPQLYPAAEELRRRFSMPTTRVFVSRAASGAYSFGVHEPYFIVFPAVQVSGIDAAEFKFMLGREMGRIKLGHTRLAPLLGSGHLSGGGITALLKRLRNGLTASYLRAQELSCDRIGVLAVRSVKPAVDRFIKQEIQPPRGAKIDIEELSAQAAEVNRGLTGLANRIRQLGHAQPDLVSRLQAITQWAGLPNPAESDAAPAPTAGAAPAKTAAPAADAAQSTPATKAAEPDGSSAPPAPSAPRAESEPGTAAPQGT